MALMPLLFAIKRTRELKGKTEHHACECIHNVFLYCVSGHKTTQVAWEIRIGKWMGPNAQPHFWVSSNMPLHTSNRLTSAKFSSLYVTRQTSKSDNIDDATMVEKIHIQIKKNGTQIVTFAFFNLTNLLCSNLNFTLHHEYHKIKIIKEQKSISTL
jgi:hypothetical protein